MQLQKESWILGAIGLVVGILLGGTGPSMQMNANRTPAMPVQEMDHAAMGHTIPESHMESMMNDMMASLNGKEGDEFDQTFLTEMIIHHEGAVEMAEMVLKTSDRKELRDFAQAIIDAQSKEIDQMKDWQAEWR